MSDSGRFPQVGRRYNRQQIHDALGGEVQSYLPAVDGRIVAICLDPAKNPTAPREVLVGMGPKIRARGNASVRQGGSLPVFLKRASAVWEFVGDFTVEDSSEDPGLLRRKARLRTGDGVSRVIWLKPAT